MADTWAGAEWVTALGSDGMCDGRWLRLLLLLNPEGNSA